MNPSFTQGQLVSLVSESVTSTKPDVGPLTADTPLIGQHAVLDSVGLITLLVSLEEKLHGAVDLAASFMSQEDPDAPEHPFRTISSLASHLHQELSSSGTAPSHDT